MEVTLPEFAAAVRAGLDGIVARGKAEAGDKTMYDALDPAVTALDRGISDGLAKADALKLALVAAEGGRDATTPMLAREGRASYLGERSVRRHQDPGATSIALLMAAAFQAPLVEPRRATCGEQSPRTRARAGEWRTRKASCPHLLSASSSSHTAGPWPGRRGTCIRDGARPGTVRIAVAAGLDEGTLGTDAVRIKEPIQEVDSPEERCRTDGSGQRRGPLVPELALDLLEDPEVRERVILSAAPLVEGLVVAAVAAAGGAGGEEVAAEAHSALMGKAAREAVHRTPRGALCTSARTPTWWRRSPSRISTVCTRGQRPDLVAEMRGLDAQVRLRSLT